LDLAGGGNGSGSAAQRFWSAIIERYCWRLCRAVISVSAVPWKSMPNHNTGMKIPATPAATFCVGLQTLVGS
jgi:hypothetical protein